MHRQSRILAFGLLTFALSGIARPSQGQAAVRHLYFPTADAKAEIGRALDKAKETKHRVMIVFGSDWCVDCWVLDTLMHHPRVYPIVHDNFEVVKVDIGEWNLNLDVTQKYGNPIEKGVPALVILDDKGTMVASTKEKTWENARGLTPEVVRDQIKLWAARK
jgi:thiol:disulfide interchange protein